MIETTMDLEALVQAIERRAKNITHWCMARRRKDSTVRLVAKKTMLRELHTLTGMVLAYNLVRSDVLPQRTLQHYNTARRAMEEME